MDSRKILPLTIASYLIEKSITSGDCITNLKLQKLVYYAQAWFIVLFGIKLFDEDIQAWVHGPVVRSIYDCYKQYGYKPLPCPRVKSDLPGDVQKHLDEILKIFGGYSGFQLELMTHQEAPWKNARKGLPPDMACDRVISPEDMRTFYSLLATNGKEG
ncbi:Panacea domain-containing protein [Victivallis vadensis]|uniref:Putative phage-associated protein n=1 Tax=Victivallis vadensis TaxID=172901 RepID=A0A2U1ACV3_9BACT|nr:type II toxin-antitoxin system antitoxin SocA domain-containing protein [Victivallis vadensis]PVY33323.1 putative phage-associated protein [Victivallis vadensis]PWM80931.1 MAG: hypothetical protein DBX90_07865 [Lentisphaerota bacterium]